MEIPGKGERPLRDELCPVAFHQFRKRVAALRKRGRIWRRHYRKSWEEIGGENTETIYPGQVFLMQRSCGGYDEERGWTGNPDDPVRWVEKAASTQPENEEVDESDDQCESEWLTIAQHCRNVCRLLEETSLQDPRIAHAIGQHAKILTLAARWHDRGKAHSVFQAKLKPTELQSTVARQRLGAETAAAKAPANAWLPPRAALPRAGFRHELASALAAMETLRAAQPDHRAFGWPAGLEPSSCNESRPDAGEHTALSDELARLSADELDLLVYLIASHHGKVRMSIRSSPDDLNATVPDPCRGDTPQARGVREGDILPTCSLPGPDGTDLRAPEVCMHLEPMSLGLSDRYGPSWRERTQALLERLGPFRLSYLEALLRAADWRASREEHKPNAETPMVREEDAVYQRQLAGAKEFVERWRLAGPALEEQHWRELQDLDDDTARRMTLDLFKLWRPSEFDDFGAGMVQQQRLFAKLREREAKEAKKR